MYAIIAVILSFAMIALTIAGERQNTQNRLFFIINTCLSGGGLVLACITAAVVRIVIFNSANTDEWKSWAWDAFGYVISSTVVPLLILTALLVASVFLSYYSKKRFENKTPSALPLAVSVAASIMLLIILPICAAITENQEINLKIAVYIFGIAESLVLRAPFIATFFLKNRINVKNK